MATVTTLAPPQQRFVFSDIDWKTYTRLLRILAKRPSIRMAYDRGVLEIMSPLFEHETDARFLNRLILAMVDELATPIVEGGSTTFRRRRHQRGIEADNSYWIAHEAQVRGRRQIDLRVDPPPDLAIEVDVPHSSLDRLSIYATLGVPELWRLDGGALTFSALGTGSQYAVVSHSLAFPFLQAADLMAVMAQRDLQIDSTAIVRQFRVWIQQRQSSGGTP